MHAIERRYSPLDQRTCDDLNPIHISEVQIVSQIVAAVHRQRTCDDLNPIHISEVQL